MNITEVDWYEETLKNVELEGHEFSMAEDGRIRIDAELDRSKVRDAVVPENVIVKTTSFVEIANIQSEEELVRACILGATYSAAHEIQEQIKFNGEFFMNPHKDGDVVKIQYVPLRSEKPAENPKPRKFWQHGK